MSTINARVIDTQRGCPAEGMPIALQKYDAKESGWVHLSGTTTEDDGTGEIPEDELIVGTYRLTFDTGTYYAANDIETPCPVIRVVFETRANARYHVTLNLSPFGWSVAIETH